MGSELNIGSIDKIKFLPGHKNNTVIALVKLLLSATIIFMYPFAIVG